MATKEKTREGVEDAADKPDADVVAANAEELRQANIAAKFEHDVKVYGRTNAEILKSVRMIAGWHKLALVGFGVKDDPKRRVLTLQLSGQSGFEQGWLALPTDEDPNAGIEQGTEYQVDETGVVASNGVAGLGAASEFNPAELPVDAQADLDREPSRVQA